LIYVNQVGKRFYNEAAGQFTSNNWHSIEGYVPNSHRNAERMQFAQANYLPAAMGLNGGTGNGGGPIWAIFDAEAVKREGWNPKPPHVDMDAGFFSTGGTIEQLAERIRSRHQMKPMPASTLRETVERYNSFVETGMDVDFEKPTPRFRIQTAPFYAAWATPVIHDTRAGLRINGRCQVQDLDGAVIPGLYCGGESAGGFSEHGLARCIVQGRISGRNAAAEKI
jgi:succinate dehydrogenase/fumarate reductase flavoprotein subunit